VNPDFAAIAAAMGAFGARIVRAEQITKAVDGGVRAVRVERRPALLHVVVDPAVLLPA
jgi:thiamine pyrophosphate-dependent acetolactate synthase large subunit-like protein